jgi:hypothetical protein
MREKRDNVSNQNGAPSETAASVSSTPMSAQSQPTPW